MRRQCCLPMTENPEASVLTAKRAPQHIRLSRANDAYEHLCILTLLPSLAPSTLCWQIHRGLTVSVPLLRMWVHCPRASNGLLPRRSNLVGYVRWDAQSDRFLLARQSFQQLSGRNPCCPLERSRWRGGSFACYAPHVMPQRIASRCGSRACWFSKYRKTNSLQVSEKIEFP